MSFLLNFVYEHWKAFLVFSIIGVMGIVLLASRQFGFTVATTISDKNTEIGNLAYEKYDGAILEGSEVINAIKRYQNELPIIIYTGESEDTYHGNFKVSNNDRKSEKYIKPSQVYNGSLLRDTNQEVVGIVFAKEGITLTETSNKELLAKILGKDAENSNMSDLINEVTTVITNKDATIQALNQTIDSLNGSVSNLQSQNSTLNNQYNTLFGEVDAGKSSIAKAITDKGIATSSSDSFLTMAENIQEIKGKMQCEMGSMEIESYDKYRKYPSGEVKKEQTNCVNYDRPNLLSFDGIDFTPRFVIFWSSSDTSCYYFMKGNIINAIWFGTVRYNQEYSSTLNSTYKIGIHNNGFTIPLFHNMINGTLSWIAIE